MNRVETRYPVPVLTPEQRNEIHSDIVKNIAMRSLMELAYSMALAAICCCFVATSAGITTIAMGLAIQTIFSLSIRIYVGYHEYRGRINPNHEVSTVAKWLGAYSLASGSVNNAQVVVHEAGHALAINALLKNANPKITLFPYEGGVTSWRGVREVTGLGQKIGRDNIQPIIAGAGPFLTLGLSTILLGVGLAEQDSSPEVSRMLIVSAIIDFFTHIHYALSALSANLSNFSHDFVALWQLGGIHPLAAAIVIAAIPILMLGAYFSLKESS
jgi:hypothetical protein